ncbi:Spy/CpxP family protein refolding chaperone [Billgrantia antri]|uniref:Spy/CpxP family protein refolding chaperone n=1 Tax=Billgrantia antri TaxID=2846777 RepID=UPI003B212774
MKISRLPFCFGLALALSATASVGTAQEMNADTMYAIGSGMTGGGMGPGMMGGGMGPGMMGSGMGPGMMGGGMGPGMMSGGMGPGMMGGGMGPGMMGDGMGGMMPCPMMSGGGKNMLSVLDQEQRSEYRELMQEHRPAQFERMGQLMNLRDDMMTALHTERPDPEEVQTLHGRMAKLHGEMMAEMVRMRNAMHDLMTEEQREQLQQATPQAVDPEDHEAHH